MTQRPAITRRTFVRSVAVGGALAAAHAPLVRAASANGKLRIGGIGVGGKGWGDIHSVSKGQIVAALCDVDAGTLDRAARAFPDAARFTDWRELIADAKVDAVTVSTPDHTHAPATLAAIRRGLHVYCQKPLTHTVWESRQVGLAAAKAGVVTQLGTQGHSDIRSKLRVDLLRRRAVGRVRQIHMWTDRPIWRQGMDRPAGDDPAPAGLNWDAWIGAAPMRPFVNRWPRGTRSPHRQMYHPFVWRGWQDFGTGALGDIGCHSLASFWDGLRMTAPLTVRSLGPAPNHESFPEWSIVEYAFDATEFSGGPFTLTWYDGGKCPPRELFPFMPDDWEMPDNGQLVVGDDGYIYRHRLYPEALHESFDYARPDSDDHYMQWTRACLDPSVKTCVPFAEFAAPMTEAVLLGNVALHYPEQTMKWNAEALAFPDHAEASKRLRRDYRDGWMPLATEG